MKRVNLIIVLILFFTLPVVGMVNFNIGIVKNEVFLGDQIDSRLMKAGFWNLTETIEIDDSNLTKNWSYTAATYEWCSGSGTWNDPYILENIIIDGQNTGRSIEVRNSNKPFIIKNCTIYNSGSGSLISAIFLNNTANGFIVNNDVSKNNGVGIFLYYGCHNNTISNCTVNNNGGMGIILRYNCYNNSILNNVVHDNDFRGIYLHTNCTHNIISGNIAGHEVNYDQDVGIQLYSGCRYNIITGNNLINNVREGIFVLTDCDNNIISNNTATNNYPSGICIQEHSDNNIITENILFGGNGQSHGIEINVRSHNNTVSNNFVKNSWGSGIRVYFQCDNNTISGNTVSSTISVLPNVHGIEVHDNCDNNIIEGNIANNNNDNGIYLHVNSENNIVMENIANNNKGHGINLESCVNTVISGNIANDNNAHGIILDNCDNNNISRNIANDNNAHGICLDNCDNNNISRNAVKSNNEIGIDLLTNCDNNTLTMNYVYFNTNGAIDIETIDCFGTKVEGNVLVSKDEKFLNDNGDNTVSSLNYYLPTIPSLRVEILEQSFSTTEYIIIINISSGLGLEPWIQSIRLWWNRIDVPTNNITELGNGLYRISLTPIFDEDLILFNMSIISINHWNKYFETYITVEHIRYLQIEIIEHSFSHNHFNFTIYICDETEQAVESATIQLWWNSVDVSADVINLGNGFYFVSLTPITVAAGEDPILLNMIISASGYEDKYFETFIAVDPASLQKGEAAEEFPLALIIVISAISAGVIIGATGIFWFRRRKEISK